MDFLEKTWPHFWGQKTVPISDPTLVLGQCIPSLLRTSPFCKSCICMWACGYACVPARAYAQARAPLRRHQCQGGRVCARSSGMHPNSANIRNASASSCGIAAPRQHAHKPQPRLVTQNSVLVRLKLIFVEKLDNFLCQKFTSKSVLKIAKLVRPKLIFSATKLYFFWKNMSPFLVSEIDPKTWVIFLPRFWGQFLNPKHGVRNWPQNLGRKMTQM